MKIRLLAIVLSLAAGTAAAQETCNFYPLAANLLEHHDAISAKQAVEATEAIHKLSVANVTASDAQAMQVGQVRLAMTAEGLWRMELLETQDKVVAATDTFLVKRGTLLDTEKARLLDFVRKMLKRSLSEGQQFNLEAKGKCWR
jgi:hypothetical protein